MGARSSAKEFADSLTATFNDLPQTLKRSLAWDQGTELAVHHDTHLAAVAPAPNARPRTTLGCHTPAQR